MHTVRFLVVFATISVLPVLIVAQPQNRADSLEGMLEKTPSDQLPGLLTELCWVNHNINPEKGIRFGLQALEMHRKNRDPAGESESLLNIGICYYATGNSEKAIEYYLLSLKIKEELNDTDGVAATLNNLGNIYKDIGNYDKARESYQKAYEISEKENGRKVMATTLSNIAITYKLQNDYDKALEYNLKALTIRQAIGDKKGIAGSLNNIAVIYADSAYKKSDLKKALTYLNKSVRLKEEIGDRLGLSQSLINTGQIHTVLKQYREANTYLEKALGIARELKATSVQIVCYQNLSDLKAKQGMFQKAYEYEVLFANLSDSLYTTESSRKIAEMQVKYETEKKEKENELLKQESKIQALQINKQRNLRNFFLILALLILGLAIAIFSRYHLKKRTNRILEEKNRQLALLNATKDKCFSIIAHDLKNPFGTLVSVSEQLAGRFDEMDDLQKKKIAGMISTSANLTHDLLENLLAWSVSQTGDLPCHPESIDIHALAAEAISLIKLNADKKEIRFVLETAKNTMVAADRNMTATVIRNLLTNAVKFSEKPGIVRIFSIDRGVMTETGIEDQGIGIDPEDAEKLFRIDADHSKIGRKRKEKGTGLGLILCREFVERNGGSIRVDSVPGRGSIFTFVLPKAG